MTARQLLMRLLPPLVYHAFWRDASDVEVREHIVRMLVIGESWRLRVESPHWRN
jgi:hypothetical protein